MKRHLFQINEVGVIEDTLPEAPTYVFGGKRRYEDSVRKIFGTGSPKPFDPNCIAGFYQLNRRALKSGDEEKAASALSAYFYYKGFLVSHDIQEDSRDFTVRINLPIERKGLAIAGAVDCSIAASKNQKALDAMRTASLTLKSLKNQPA